MTAAELGPQGSRNCGSGQNFERGDPMTVGMLRDAAMVLPEITELAAAVIHEDAVLIDAEMDLCWLRKVLSSPCKSVLSDQNARSLQFQADHFTALLKRAATTKPKTARGHAIKARIAAKHRKLQRRCVEHRQERAICLSTSRRSSRSHRSAVYWRNRPVAFNVHKMQTKAIPPPYCLLIICLSMRKPRRPRRGSFSLL